MTTDPVAPVATPEQLADRYGVSREFVLRQARSRSWPHLRVGRRIAFTAEHVAQIDALLTVARDPQRHDPSWGRRQRAS